MEQSNSELRDEIIETTSARTGASS